MSDVWSIISADGAGAQELAALLLAQRKEVAVISPDVGPFALLVNAHADAVLTAELRDPDLLALTEAAWSIEESFGQVDVIAFVDGDDDPQRMRRAADFFAERWPDAEVLNAPKPLPTGAGAATYATGCLLP
jgi:hypothetical protein